jgi:xanthine dehydrogenase YagS FAD-binding subunit
MFRNFAYVRPRTVKEAVQFLGEPGSAVHAGGTDLLGTMRDGVANITRVVSMTDLPNLKGIRTLSDGSIEIGALTTITEIAENGTLRRDCRVLAEAAASVASPQLRNQGTTGGNVCQRPRCWYFRGDFPCLRKGGDFCSAARGQNQYHCIFGGDGCYYVHPSDTAPALMVLNARLSVTGPKGARSIPVEEFFVPPSKDVTRETVLENGEILTHIVLPGPSAGARSTYRKIRERAAWDFALAGMALLLQMDGQIVRRAGIVLSGVAPVPWRAVEAEKVLAGRPLDAETASAVAEASVANAEPLEYNGYKVPLVRGLVYQTLLSM